MGRNPGNKQILKLKLKTKKFFRLYGMATIKSILLEFYSVSCKFF